MVKFFQSALGNGSCDACTTWKLDAGDTWGLEYQGQEQQDAGHAGTRQMVPVGQWSPREGLKMLDRLFPHIGHGFAGRNLPVVSFHVSLCNRNNWKFIPKIHFSNLGRDFGYSELSLHWHRQVHGQHFHYVTNSSFQILTKNPTVHCTKTTIGVQFQQQ